MACSGCQKAAQRRAAARLAQEETVESNAPKHYEVVFPDGTIESYGTPIPARRRAEQIPGATVQEAV